MTMAILRAIHESGQTPCSIARAVGMDRASLGRFLAGKQSLRLDIADRLAAHFGLVLVARKAGK